MIKNIHFKSVSKTVAEWVKTLIETVESAPFSLGSFVISFTALIIVRLLIESGIGGFSTESLPFLFSEFSHTFLFFLFSFLLFLPLARLAGASSWSRAANLLLFGFLIIWTPPIIDKLIFGDRMFWSFYALDGLQGLFFRFFQFFGGSPNLGITYGVRVEVAVMSIGLGLYAYIRSKKGAKAIGIAFLSYVLFFILGTFPSFVAIIALAPSRGLFGISELDVVGFMLTPRTFLGKEMVDPRMSLGIRMSIVYALLASITMGGLLYRMSKKTFLALLGNVRWPQIFWHGGLFFLGGGLALLYTAVAVRFDFFEVLGLFLLLSSVICAWLSSVIVNDLADRSIDALTNAKRPLPANVISMTLYRTIGILFFSASLLFAGIVSLKAVLLLLAYQAIAYLYSATPYRLKRVPFVATVLSAIAGILVLLIGFFAISPSADSLPIPLTLLAFLTIAYAVTIPLKDFKDIKGDRADGVYTIPVILGVGNARAIIGSTLFLCYAASPLILHEPRLILPAIVFGALAFLSVARARDIAQGKDSFRALPAWNMLFILLYGCIVTLFLLF
ncbi:MAG: UbiA family prenyltransferase [Candidatus Moraniibacteriota bacterium]